MAHLSRIFAPYASVAIQMLAEEDGKLVKSLYGRGRYIGDETTPDDPRRVRRAEIEVEYRDLFYRQFHTVDDLKNYRSSTLPYNGSPLPLQIAEESRNLARRMLPIAASADRKAFASDAQNIETGFYSFAAPRIVGSEGLATSEKLSRIANVCLSKVPGSRKCEPLSALSSVIAEVQAHLGYAYSPSNIHFYTHTPTECYESHNEQFWKVDCSKLSDAHTFDALTSMDHIPLAVAASISKWFPQSVDANRTHNAAAGYRKFQLAVV